LGGKRAPLFSKKTSFFRANGRMFRLFAFFHFFCIFSQKVPKTPIFDQKWGFFEVFPKWQKWPKSGFLLKMAFLAILAIFAIFPILGIFLIFGPKCLF
jgi:hypothetical protein